MEAKPTVNIPHIDFFNKWKPIYSSPVLPWKLHYVAIVHNKNVMTVFTTYVLFIQYRTEFVWNVFRTDKFMASIISNSFFWGVANNTNVSHSLWFWNKLLLISKCGRIIQSKDMSIFSCKMYSIKVGLARPLATVLKT